MRNWGILVTIFYFLVVTLLLLPGVPFIAGEDWEFPEPSDYTDWILWVWIGVLVLGQALLLFLSVDTSRKKLKPRQHVIVSLATITLMIALLTLAASVSFMAAVLGDDVFENEILFFMEDSAIPLIAWLVGLWVLWAVLFALSRKRIPDQLNQLINWVFRGSVLELLIAVPSHIIVRHRDDCSAPFATGFGIATGIAIMLLCFGPGVMFLYKKRLDSYHGASR